MVLGLAALAIMVTATHAHATPIRFDNPPGTGHFDWAPPVGEVRILDVTLPAESQDPGASHGESTIGQYIIDTTRSRLEAPTDGLDMELGGYSDVFALPVGFGEMIPSGAPFDNVGWVYFEGYDSEFPEGLEAYLGVQFPIAGETHYGWVGAVRTGLELDAFAWGYETEVGVPIAAGAPEPGTLAMLAVGAAALVGRRRRRDSQID